MKDTLLEVFEEAGLLSGPNPLAGNVKQGD